MTDRTNRLAPAIVDALERLAAALASVRHAANEDRQLEEELEAAWQARDWETVRRLQDEDEPDPLDESDHGDDQ